jgi:alpha-N-arabinofuranosidase
VGGLRTTKCGDNRYYNNIFIGNDKEDLRRRSGLDVYKNAELPMHVNGNVYMGGARTYKGEENQLVLSDDPKVRIEELEDGVYLSMILDKAVAKMKNEVVTTDLLGKAKVPEQRFENPDGSEITVDEDYFFKKRNLRNPSPGPFSLGKEESIRLKIWPKE